MSIKIKMKKEVIDGKKGWRIMSIDGVHIYAELPSEYKEDGTRFWRSGNRCITVVSTDVSTDVNNEIYIGNWYPELKINDALEYYRQAGQRLHEINLKIKKLKEEWQGEETFVI